MGIEAWADLVDLPADRPALPGGDDEWNGYLVAASETLYGLTGRRYPGIRERAVEVYAPARCGEHRCHACRPLAVRLPNRPVVALLAVRTRDGEPLPVGNYRLARGGYLEAAPGVAAVLPTCSVPLRLRYRFGRAVSDAGRVHAAALALALGQARLDPDSSPLPGTITSIVRQGTTLTLQPASALNAAGLTGLAAVDSWVSSVNPTRSTRRPRSWSPDTEARHYPLDLTEVPLP